ncbi:septum formation initiator family protein [Oleiharenicola lentus]|uniref:Septum formation initiator family protein n=1 Tax=Oleiharenicola lentus TaxID=2508720 RepID=A0A4V1M6L6_9BACT|nr:septum formation initiator family protein [Oleiharenicola lentus]RXK55829.1 septum formation initiator family protein [Oleiharenicola lentus]
MNLSKIINGVFGVLFAGITLWAVTAFVGMQRELKTRQADLATKQRLLAEAEAKLAAQTRYLDRLRNDPALVELLIRQKLGYAKGEEFVFRFEEVKP